MKLFDAAVSHGRVPENASFARAAIAGLGTASHVHCAWLIALLPPVLFSTAAE
jgi:hypothetical protein